MIESISLMIEWSIKLKMTAVDNAFSYFTHDSILKSSSNFELLNYNIIILSHQFYYIQIIWYTSFLSYYFFLSRV